MNRKQVSSIETGSHGYKSSPRRKVTSFFRKKSVITTALVVVFVGGSIFLFWGNGKPVYETREVRPVTVTKAVSETGVVESAQNISLSFARSGRVEEVLVKKGSQVEKGDILASLQTSALNADLRQARAILEREQITLKDLLKGPREEDIAVIEASVEQARTTLQNAELDLVDEVTDAYVVADDAVHAKADQLFTNTGGDRPLFGIDIEKGSTIYYIGASTDQQTAKINQLRREVETRLNDLESKVFSESLEDKEETAQQTEDMLKTTQRLLTEIGVAINDYVAGDTDAQAVYEDLKGDISTARTNINSSLSSLRSAIQTYHSAQASLTIKDREFDLKTATPTCEATALQRARIEEAQARVEATRSQINDALITSPITGLVTAVDINSGEVVSSAAPVLSVISDKELQMSVNIPEDDIAFVEVGDHASVSFDAYDGVSFDAEIVFISPSADFIDGVPVFEVILEFSEEDERIRPGLSVDIDIAAEEREEVLAVPSRAVVEQGGRKYVRVIVSDNSYREQTVTTGLSGEGMVEITSGLKEGDTVITFVESGALDDLTLIEQ